MSPNSSDPPEAKIEAAKAKAFEANEAAKAKAFDAKIRSAALAIVGVLSAVATIFGVGNYVRMGDQTPKETSKAAYESALNACREDNGRTVAWAQAEFAKRDAYLDGVLRVMPQYVVTPQGAKHRSAVVIAPPVKPAEPPKPPGTSRAPELSKPESFDQLAK